MTDAEVLAVLQHVQFSAASITRDLAVALHRHAVRTRPRVIIDAGSGASTVALACYARHSGARLISFEHDPAFFGATASALGRAAVAQQVDLRLVQIAEVAALGLRGRCYAMGELPDGIDFVFIDGPPSGPIGRRLVLPSLAAHLASRWEAWAHDALREPERSDLQEWRRVLSFDCTISTEHDRRGVAMLTSSTTRRVEPVRSPGSAGQRRTPQARAVRSLIRIPHRIRPTTRGARP